MRLVVSSILVFGCAGALAQPGASFGPTAQLLERRLGQLTSGLLVVVDGPKGEWKGKVDDPGGGARMDRPGDSRGLLRRQGRRGIDPAPAAAPGRAAALAVRCGQPNFAAQWAALGAGR